MAAHKYVVLGKFYSELNKALTFGERIIEADGYFVDDAGSITFHLREKREGQEYDHFRYIESIPPGFWIHIGEIDEEQGAGIVNNTNISITDMP